MLAGLLAAFAAFAALGSAAGWRALTPAFCVGLLVVCVLSIKTRPGNTLFDPDARVALLGRRGKKAETVPFADIYDLREVERGGARGYCIRMKANPLFDARLIGDVLPENPYSREFRIQALPKIRRALALPDAPANPALPPGDARSCFEPTGRGWERKLTRFAGRTHTADPENRTLTITRGFLFPDSDVYSFDDVASFLVRLRGDGRADLLLRFTRGPSPRFIARGTPDELRDIASCYVKILESSPAEEIEYTV